MGDNSSEPQVQEELPATTQPEAPVEVGHGSAMRIENELPGVMKRPEPESSEAVKIVQAASHHLQDRYTLPPYLREAGYLVDYIWELKNTIKALRNEKGDDDKSDSGSHFDGDSSGEVSKKPAGVAATGPTEFTIKKEIKVKGDDRYDNVRWLEDHGDDSFSKEYSTGSEDKHPITRRRTFHKTGMHLSTSIRIHSQILLEMLKEIIVPSLSPEYEQLYSQEVKFHQPYVILFQNRSGLQKALADEKDEQKTALLRLLLDFLEKERPNAWKKLDEIEAGTCEHISFEDAWLLYAPGTTIFARSSKTWEAYKVGEIEVKQLPQLGSIRINTYSLDFDHSGTKLVPAGDMLFMTPFTGTRLMSDLEVIPEAFLPDRETIVKDVRTRGEAFWEFNTHPAYRQYIGSAWPTTLASDYVRVIIDYVSPSRYDKTDEGAGYDVMSDTDNHLPQTCTICAWKYAGLAPYPPKELDMAKICPKDRWSKLPGNVSHVRMPLTTSEDVFIFSPSRVWAFSLKHKSWKMVEVHKLSPVSCAKDPFEKLVMSDQYKLVVESMVDSHLGKPIFSDIVKDKGRGLIVLLHGGPGTGKTLTAECVAEKKMRPLYMVTCGDLGTNPDELEKRLQRTFLYAVNWNAILLLDEADVFLQERDLQDLHRNALVSIFLRHIEYYDGLLFLTTNRPGQIDEAFQSRIHITLGLPDLDFRLQKQVWLIFIRMLKFEDSDKDATRAKKLQLLGFVETELEGLLVAAGYHMNGRQIRNCISAASAIARKNGRDLQKEDITTVIELGAQFKDYMQKVNRMTQDEKARALGLRLLQKD